MVFFFNKQQPYIDRVSDEILAAKLKAYKNESWVISTGSSWTEYADWVFVNRFARIWVILNWITRIELIRGLIRGMGLPEPIYARLKFMLPVNTATRSGGQRTVKEGRRRGSVAMCWATGSQLERGHDQTTVSVVGVVERVTGPCAAGTVTDVKSALAMWL